MENNEKEMPKEQPEIRLILNIQRFIFWLDKNIENDENQNYLKELKKEFPKYEIKTFSSIESSISHLEKEKEKYDFKFIYFIISGRLAEDFFNSYNLLTDTTIIAATIVFCGNISLHSSKPYANDLYLNPGGVVIYFDEVIHYIKSEEDYLWYCLTKIQKNSFSLPEENKVFGNTFEYARSLTDITLPIVLTEIIKKNLIQDKDILNFKTFMFAKYKDDEKRDIILPLVKPSLEKNVYIPLKKRAKFLLRLYTLETNFYRNINKDMRKLDGFGFYKVFILILYFSIQNKSLKSYVKGKLYRRALLSKNEMEEIIKIFEIKKNNIIEKNEISSILYYSKPFLSFSKEREKTLNFAKEIFPNTVRVTFILNPAKCKDNVFFSNIDIDTLKLSLFDEKEVLFLPLSCFEIEDYKKIGENEYEITLNYLDKYYDQLKKKISIIKEQKELQKFYEKVLESSFSKKLVECIEDYHNIYNNIIDFFMEHTPIQEVNLKYYKLIPKLSHKSLKVWELKSTYGCKANLGYNDEAFTPMSEKVNLENTYYIKEALVLSKDSNLAELQEFSLLRRGYASANLFGAAIGYNLANIDNFIKFSNKDKAKTLGATLGITTGMYILSNSLKSAVPMVSTALVGGFYIYDLGSDIKNKALTKNETAISILKNTTNLVVNLGTGIGGFYAGLKIGVSLGIITGPGVVLIGLGSGIIGGLIGGLFGRYLTSSKMVLNCNSFYKNYIPLKYREEGNIPDLFWKDVNKKAKSLAIEAIIDKKYKTWSVINIPPQIRKMEKDIGETLIKYGKFRHYNPNTVDYMLYSIKKEIITKEDWNDQNKNKELILEVAILEVDNL